MTVDPCPACGAGDSDVLSPAGRPDVAYRRCRACRTGRLDPIPSADEREPYDAGYFINGGSRAGYADYEASEPWHRRTARSRLRRVGAASVKRRESPLLVDVGGAVGYLADEATRIGWRAVTVEASAWAAGRATQRGLTVAPSLADLGHLAGTVDAVTFFQSLEHLPDPEDALRSAASLLRPGGVVVIETWDATSRTARLSGRRWQQLSPPSVLWLFSPGGLGAMAQRAGLEPRTWRPTPKVVSAATVVGQALAEHAPRLVEVAEPVLSRLPVPYAFDDLITCAALKPGRESTVS